MHPVSWRTTLKLAAIAGFLLFGVERFLPSIPLALIPHDTDSIPDVSREPLQETVDEEPIERPGGEPVRLVRRASLDIAGEVVGIERYFFDGAAFIIPFDVALRWGAMLEEPYLSQVTYRQNARFCIWGTDRMTFDRQLITAHMANVHVIPSSGTLKRALRHVRRGDHVRLSGVLVDVEGLDHKEGFRWTTSLSRTDTDNASCETLYLREINVDGRVYR